MRYWRSVVMMSNRHWLGRLTRTAIEMTRSDGCGMLRERIWIAASLLRDRRACIGDLSRLLHVIHSLRRCTEALLRRWCAPNPILWKLRRTFSPRSLHRQVCWLTTIARPWIRSLLPHVIRRLSTRWTIRQLIVHRSTLSRRRALAIWHLACVIH